MDLAEVTTLRVGGPAGVVVEATTEADLIAAVEASDSSHTPVLLVGGGSNLLVADAGFAGTVILVRTRGITEHTDQCSGATVTVAAGEVWDDFVAHAVAHEWVGVEALSGIPGSVGATPIQNVGAYGQDVAQTLASVRTWDRVDRRVRTLRHADCDFSYRHSRFKAEPDRYVVLDVTFQLRLGDLGVPVAYPELARTLGIEVGERASLVQVRDAVVALRRGKGMVLDSTDHDTWSAGSFFTNPIIEPGQVPHGAPAFAQPDGRVKTSAAWLIDHAGFPKGFALTPAAGLSTKHVLALTNRGSAQASDLVDLARAVRDGVRQAYGIELVPEPNLVGVSLAEA